MIIWLASYPRSGNTLTRIMLNDVFGAAVPSIYEEDRTQQEYNWGDLLPPTASHRPADLTREQFLEYARSSPDVFFVKTHAPPPESDEAAILIVRDGRAAISSFEAYQKSFWRHPRSLAHIVIGGEGMLNWSRTNAAWLRRSAPTLLLHYESITADPAGTIARLAEFTGQAPRGEFTRSFADMRAINPDFFRQGSNAPGIAHVETECGALFWALHGDMMRALGYLDDSCRPKSNALFEQALAEAGAALESYAARIDNAPPEPAIPPVSSPAPDPASEPAASAVAGELSLRAGGG